MNKYIVIAFIVFFLYILVLGKALANGSYHHNYEKVTPEVTNTTNVYNKTVNLYKS